MNKNRFLLGYTVAMCLFYTDTNAKSLTVSNAVMKGCIFNNKTMSFNECLIKRGTIKDDSTPPAPEEPTPDPEDPTTPDEPTPPDNQNCPGKDSNCCKSGQDWQGQGQYFVENNCKNCPSGFQNTDSNATALDQCFRQGAGGLRVYYKKITCPRGQYLPAGRGWNGNTNGCENCPDDGKSYCPSTANYWPDFSKPQGIKKCENGKVPTADKTGCETAPTPPEPDNPEKAACIKLSNNSSNQWDEVNKTCVNWEGSGVLGWGGVWNHQTLTFDCLNPIEYANYQYTHNEITQSQKQHKYDWFYDHVYDASGNLRPRYKEPQFYIPPTGAKFPDSPKCASKIERQCYNKSGFYYWGYNWDDLDGSDKCYSPQNDKTKCEVIGAKFRKENEISYCDCKISGANKEFHWNSRDGNCQYKINNQTYNNSSRSSYFFEGCLLNYLNTPFFNGAIKPSGISAFQPLNCQ